MPDLDAAIRAKLDQRENDMEYGNETLVGDLLQTITAALDLHTPFEDGVCSCLPDSGDTHVAHRYPCPTVRAIAAKLDVSPPA